jgi:Mn2+/Fe2+ NRAMP family transporter
MAQFMGWPWGKKRRPRHAARFALSWVVLFVGAALIVLTGINPVSIVEYSIIFSVIVLPFSYFPLIMIASDKRIMGRHANGALSKTLGWLFFMLITAAALAAIPLLVLTHGGKG